MSFEDKKAAYAKAVAEYVYTWKDEAIMGSSERTWNTFEQAVKNLPSHGVAPTDGPRARTLQKWRNGETPETRLALRALMAIGFPQEDAFETLNQIRRDVGLSAFIETAEDLLNPPSQERSATSLQDPESAEPNPQIGDNIGEDDGRSDAKRLGFGTPALILGGLLCAAVLGLIFAGDSILQIGETNVIGNGNEVTP